MGCSQALRQTYYGVFAGTERICVLRICVRILRLTYMLRPAGGRFAVKGAVIYYERLHRDDF